MAAIPGSIPVTGFIAPTDTLDTFATHNSEYGRGDKHLETQALRDSITEARRQWGMLCHVYNDGANNGSYQLVYGQVDTNINNNANWVLFAGSGGSGGKIATDSVDLTALVTTADGDKATLFTLASTPVDGSYIIVDVNGKLETVGDALTTKAFYFSGDGGTTPRSFSSLNPNGQVQSGDELFFNGSVAGYELDVTDRISIYQQVN
jgi:hypothetical protein